MQLKKGTEIQVQIQTLNISGRGVGEILIDDKHYFVAVDRCFPQDEVIAKITKIKKNYLEAELCSFFKKSNLRVAPTNDYADICGSTPWETLSYDYQLEIKSKEVTRILGNIQCSEVKVNPILPSPDLWFYRNKMQYSFGFDHSMQKVLGLHVANRRFDIFDVKNCHLADSEFNLILDFLRITLFDLGLIPYSFTKGTGDLRDLTLRVSKSSRQLILILTVSEQAPISTLKPVLQEIQIKFPRIKICLLEIITVAKGRTTKSEFLDLSLDSSKQFITETVTIEQHSFQFAIKPTTFFQPNSKAASLIFSEVSRLAALTPDDIVYDLFSGSGTIGISLSQQAKFIYGLDISPQSIDCANLNLNLNKILNAEYLASNIYDFHNYQHWPTPNIVVVDPPRAGLTPKVVEYIVKLNPRKIVYVSCNLKTFCQDILVFQKFGRKLVEITPIDQFPHTRHLEVVSLIT